MGARQAPSPWDFPGKNNGVGGHFLLHRIFLIQALNPHLLHWQVVSLPLSHQGSPNSKDLTEAEEMKRQKYTWGLYKKGNNDPDNHEGAVAHLDPDTQECEVQRALVSITTNKAGGGDEIPAELFQIQKDAAAKGLHPVWCQQIWKTELWP